MYAPKTIIAITIAAAAAPAFAQSFGEPLEAREDLSLAGNARSVNFVRSLGEAMGMKRSEVEDILAREYHQKHHGHRHGHKHHHGVHHGHMHPGGFKFRPHHRPHPHGHHHGGHEHEHKHFGGMHHARGEQGGAHAAAAHGQGPKPHRQPGHKPAFKPHGRKHGSKHGSKHGPHRGNSHGQEHDRKQGTGHRKGAKPAHAAAHAARALLERAQPSGSADESGAISLWDVIGMLRREDIEMLERADFGDELMMREAMETRNLEELD